MAAKLAIAFDQIDAAGNHLITREDLLSLGNQMCSAFREDLSSPKGSAVIDASLHLWNRLGWVAGTTGTPTFDRDEYVAAMRTMMLDDAPAFDSFFSPLASAWMSVADFDDDGRIGREEFTAWQVILGTPVAEVKTAFTAMDADGDGILHLGALMDAMYDFYACSDPNAAGNSLFGRLDRII